MPTQSYNLVLGSLPQLNVALIDKNRKIDGELIPNGIADGTIVVSNGRVNVGGGASLHVTGGGNVVVEDGGIIYGRVGDEEATAAQLGAVGNGVTDDTAAFQRGFDDPKLRTIVVPTGTYNVDGTIFVRKPTRIVGHPGAVLVKTAANAQDPMFVIGGPSIDVSGVEFHGLDFTGSSALLGGNVPAFSANVVAAMDGALHSDNARSCLAMFRCRNVLVANCVFDQFGGAVAVTSNGLGASAGEVSDVVFQDCEFSDYGRGISSRDASTLVVNRCRFVDGAGSAWTDSGDSTGLFFLDSTIDTPLATQPTLSWTETVGGVVRGAVLTDVASGFLDLRRCSGIHASDMTGSVGSNAVPFATLVESDDVHVGDATVSFPGGAPAVVVEYGDGVRVGRSSFSYPSSGGPRSVPLLVRGWPPGEYSRIVVDDVTVRYSLVVADQPALHAAHASARNVRVVSDAGFARSPFVACVGCLDLSGDGASTAWNVGPIATADPDLAEPVVGRPPSLALVPDAVRGLASSSSSGANAFPTKILGRYADSQHVAIQTIAGVGAASLYTLAAKADAVAYSHRLDVPPIPGSFVLRFRLYVDGSAAAPGTIVPIMDAPSRLAVTLARVRATIVGDGSVSLYVRSDVLETTTPMSANAWTEVVVRYRRTQAISISVGGFVRGTAVPGEVGAVPAFDDLYIGSAAWRFGTAWIDGVVIESLERSVTTSPVTRGVFVGNGRLIAELDASNIKVGTLDNARLPANISVTNVTVAGTLSVLSGQVALIQTETHVTDQVVVTNAGTGPALVVNQLGAEDIATFSDDGNVIVRVHDGGAVSVGGDVASPLAPLHVVGNVYSSGYFVGNGAAIRDVDATKVTFGVLDVGLLGGNVSCRVQ